MKMNGPCVAVYCTEPRRGGRKCRHKPFRHFRQAFGFDVAIPFQANHKMPSLSPLPVVVEKERFGIEKNLFANPIPNQFLFVCEIAHPPHGGRITFDGMDNGSHFLVSALMRDAAS